VTSLELDALLVSLRVGLAALALVVPLGLALALYLARGPARGRTLAEAVIMLPLVLPPVAVGVGLLVLFGRRGLGPWLASVGVEVVSSWRGAALASAVVALPVFVRVARTAIESVDPRLEEMAALLGASPLRIATTVTLPLARRGLLAATTLAFARALGEFGATVLVAGSIVGRTQTLPLAIFEATEGRDDATALRLCAISALLGLALAFVAARLEPRSPRSA
jgi:molybdate transport system permease protein